MAKELANPSWSSDIIEFHRKVLALKKVLRKGWVRCGVPDPESVADHSFGVALLAMLYASRLHLNVEKAVIMALLHDLGESIIGDITPHDHIPADEKRRLETAAITTILSALDRDGKLLELWKDLEERRNAEGRLVKDLDRLEMVLQAASYEQEHHCVLPEFFNIDSLLQVPEVQAVVEQLKQQR